LSTDLFAGFVVQQTVLINNNNDKAENLLLLGPLAMHKSGNGRNINLKPETFSLLERRGIKSIIKCIDAVC
jgi:hypothetical protein